MYTAHVQRRLRTACTLTCSCICNCSVNFGWEAIPTNHLLGLRGVIRGTILREQRGSRQILVLVATPHNPQSIRSQVCWQVCTLVSLEEPLQLHAIPAENLTHLLVVHLTILWRANLDGRADTDAEMRLVGQEGQTPPPETERNPDVELLPQTPRSCTGPLWHIIELILSDVVGWNKRHAMLDRLPHEAKLGWKEDLLLLRVGLQLLVDTSRADEDRPP
mmetsp:Transcript_46435/g.117789  ORF Transcript_46435/g.117789 Transcript_46435/m.117789 type:complete len:219 (+) Transcript_46435:68-724(+)